MREGSYAEIEHGTKVIGADQEPIGTVQEVVVDEGSGIFIGLSVRPNLFTHPLLVPGNAVDRLHEGTVYVNVVRSELEPYLTPSERRHEALEAFEEVKA